MEQGLLKKIEKMNFRTQMEAFYTAYSKVASHSRYLWPDKVADLMQVSRYQIFRLHDPVLLSGRCRRSRYNQGKP